MRALTARPDLEIRIRAGHGGLDRTVRWAHVTELHDPVRWLRGENSCDRGLNVGATEAEQRAYVARLDTAGCAGLGFALDTWLTEIPPAMVDEAEQRNMPLLSVEGNTPFIAIVEAVAEHYATEQLRLQGKMLTAQDAMVRSALRTGLARCGHGISPKQSPGKPSLDQNGLTTHSVPGGEHPGTARCGPRSSSTGTGRAACRSSPTGTPPSSCKTCALAAPRLAGAALLLPPPPPPGCSPTTLHPC